MNRFEPPPGGMENGGLNKLVEEAGEAIQVVGKILSFGLGPHPDGKGDLKERLEDELADLMAAIRLVRGKFRLDMDRMAEREDMKLRRFREWDVSEGRRG